jgi:hypothetical protein
MLLPFVVQMASMPESLTVSFPKTQPTSKAVGGDAESNSQRAPIPGYGGDGLAEKRNYLSMLFIKLCFISWREEAHFATSLADSRQTAGWHRGLVALRLVASERRTRPQEHLSLKAEVFPFFLAYRKT